jgi:hypothetical protein
VSCSVTSLCFFPQNILLREIKDKEEAIHAIRYAADHRKPLMIRGLFEGQPKWMLDSRVAGIQVFRDEDRPYLLTDFIKTQITK